jgi:DNA polymerase I
MKTLLLIDANSIIHRCFHALPPLTTPDGRPAQALYGISSMLLKFLSTDAPDYAAACFDRPEPTFRKKAYALYKAQRPKAPDELISQIIEAHHLFEEFGIKTVEKAGFEADDIIATLATTFGSEKDIQTVILTGDLDTLQIVNDRHIKVRTFRKGLSDTVTYDEAGVKERYGLEPRQLIDYKTLVGDKSDNVPGVPGVGEKTATNILQKYDTLEKFLKNLSKEPKYKEKFSKSLEQITSSKFLVTVKKDVPLGVASLDDLSFSLKNKEELKKYFDSMGFESLIRRLEDGGGRKNEKITIPKRPHNASLFENRNETPASFGFASATVIADKSGKKAVTELTPTELKNIIFIREGSAISREELSSKKIKVGFELKELSKKCIAEGEEPLSLPFADLGVAFWLLDPDFKAYEPEALIKIFIGDSWRGDEKNYRDLYALAIHRLKEYNMVKLFEEVEMPLTNILARMESWGIHVSRERLKKLEREINGKLALLTRAIHKAADRDFNINSPKQLAEVLYGDLGLTQKKGAKISTSAERLQEIKDAHPVVPLILQYREDFKIQSTYVKPLQELLDKTGKLHTQFMQTGAATGRISSKNPNLQNIPQESSWSKPLRQAFMAEKGFSFLSFDYSQLELRILAGITGDRNMTRAFQEKQDIHSITAAMVFGISEDKVTHHERRIAKALNFGLVYGMGPSAFAASSGVTRSEAEAFIKAYFKTFSGVARWMEEVKQKAHKQKYAETLTGRRRYFPDINSGHPRIVAENERQAMNHPVQGLEADLLKLAMIKSETLLKRKKLWGTKVRMLLTIHDELLFEVENGIMQEIIPLLRAAMQGVWPGFPVELTVEASLGTTWGDMEKVL